MAGVPQTLTFPHENCPDGVARCYVCAAHMRMHAGKITRNINSLGWSSSCKIATRYSRACVRSPVSMHTCPSLRWYWCTAAYIQCSLSFVAILLRSSNFERPLPASMRKYVYLQMKQAIERGGIVFVRRSVIASRGLTPAGVTNCPDIPVIRGEIEENLLFPDFFFKSALRFFSNLFRDWSKISLSKFFLAVLYIFMLVRICFWLLLSFWNRKKILVFGIVIFFFLLNRVFILAR